MREIVHIQAGQCGNQIGAKVNVLNFSFLAKIVLHWFLDVVCQLTVVIFFALTLNFISNSCIFVL